MSNTPIHNVVTIGTRASPLALVQSRLVQEQLEAAYEELEGHILPVKTSGDQILDRPLADAGGKGLFTKELDIALVEGRIDLAVHSAKDMETWLPEGIVIGAVLPRGDVRDILVCRKARTLADLPLRATVGTSSLRRQAQILHARPDLSVTLLRGNVQTRLQKLRNGEVEATLLAKAGLDRLGIWQESLFTPLDPDVMLPAAGQGTLAITIRASDDRMAACLAPFNHRESHTCLRAERALLAALDGSCRTPIGGLAEFQEGGWLRLRGLAATPDGVLLHQVERLGSEADAERMGEEAGQELRILMGDKLP